MSLTKKHTEYIGWVNGLKTLTQKTQIKASISVNKANWGSAVVEELSKDLKAEFPNQKGFLRSNLFSMKKWFEFYSKSEIDLAKIQQLVEQIPWGQNVLITSKAKSVEEAVFYSNKTIENNLKNSSLEVGYYSYTNRRVKLKLDYIC